jgi:hydroxyethylthiazole kinase-like uncharacterized protein yjeF
MKIFTCEQIREIDKFTIENEPVASIDLMERASMRLYEKIIRQYDRSVRFMIFTGAGNNGGDGLALGRLLITSGYQTEVYHVHYTDNVSDDWKINFDRLNDIDKSVVNTVDSTDDLPVISRGDIIIDAIFGSGLTRPPDGLAGEVIRFINQADNTVISVDMPSGLFGEDNGSNTISDIINADLTLTFQFPRLSFMFADNYRYTGEWIVLPIGLHPSIIRDIETPYHFLEEVDIIPLIKSRGRFDHKGHYGHALLVAGSHDKAGAAVLASRAALRAGAGLVTCHVPYSTCQVIQTASPEAMTQPDIDKNIITRVDNPDNFSAIGIGPGIGTHSKTAEALKLLLESGHKPMVIDADALNILGKHKEWYSLLRPDIILTPHPGEFERIAGKTSGGYERLMTQISFSVKNKCVVVLKGAFTSVSLPDGKVYHNSTGNPGMATAGSGDVLTGIILSLLAQGYSPGNAALTGVFIHGLAGDIAAGESSLESVIASDIINNLGNAFKDIKERMIDQ